jgi:carbamoyl-phosphate synthase large subunit
MVLPPHTLGRQILNEVREATVALAEALNVVGLMNIQYAIKDNDLYILEVNPRASRTVPFVSKAIGVPLAKYAARVMAGETLKDIGFTEEIIPEFWAVKESVFPFVRFPGAPITLSPEMRSTGEVMGIDDDLGLAFAKTHMAVGPDLPRSGNIFLSVKDSDKSLAVDIARRFAALGFTIYSTGGTRKVLEENGVVAKSVNKVNEGRPNVVDLIKNRDLQMIINTPAGMVPRQNENVIRTEAIKHGIPIMTTLSGARAAVQALQSLSKHDLQVVPLQHYRNRIHGSSTS